MIEFKQGDLFEDGAQALVNPVNCAGVMGRGLALEFKRRFPDNFAEYSRDCRAGKVKPGRMFRIPDLPPVYHQLPNQAALAGPQPHPGHRGRDRRPGGGDTGPENPVRRHTRPGKRAGRTAVEGSPGRHRVRPAGPGGRENHRIQAAAAAKRPGNRRRETCMKNGEMPLDTVRETLNGGFPGIFHCPEDEDPGCLRVQTPLLHPCGGPIDVYVYTDGPGFTVTDRGMAMNILERQLPAAGEKDRRLADAARPICEGLGVDITDGEWTVRAGTPEEAGKSALTLAQALLRVSIFTTVFRITSEG